MHACMHACTCSVRVCVLCPGLLHMPAQQAAGGQCFWELVCFVYICGIDQGPLNC